MIRYDAARRALILGSRSLPVARSLPVGKVEHFDTVLTDGEPFHLRKHLVPFENGWALSVIWGDLSGSDNHDRLWPPDGIDRPFVEEPERVEVAVLTPDGELAGSPFDYVEAAELVLLAEHVATLPTDGSLEPRRAPRSSRRHWPPEPPVDGHRP